jgi:hypothetical protein
MIHKAAAGRICFLFATKMVLEEVAGKEKMTGAGKVKPETE